MGRDLRLIRGRIVLAVSFVVAGGLMARHAPQAQSPAAPAVPAAAVIDDLVAANRILANEGIVDAFGHVSVRDPANPGRYFLSQNLAPELVTAADIMEYDVETSDPIDPKGRPIYLERFIHGAIYKARPDVQSVVHSHSLAIIPFGVVGGVPLRPIYHMSGFLYAGVPVYDIRADAGLSDMLIRNVDLGRALARKLGDKPVALLRGHGAVVVGPTIPIAVYRAIYTDVNARLQTQATALGGPITYLDPEEGRQFDAVVPMQVRRPWELWKKKAMGR
jgi:HCOMODA/2-hydroxy-3-carboxy-muconic semialdehyde decarboxylase